MLYSELTSRLAASLGSLTQRLACRPATQPHQYLPVSSSSDLSDEQQYEVCLVVRDLLTSVSSLIDNSACVIPEPCNANISIDLKGVDGSSSISHNNGEVTKTFQKLALYLLFCWPVSFCFAERDFFGLLPCCAGRLAFADATAST